MASRSHASERARIVRAAVVGMSSSHVRWQDAHIGGVEIGRTSRLWIADSGLGWEAWVSTRFTRPTLALTDAQLYDTAL